MDDRIVPRFRDGDYDGGVREGTRALLDMAGRGPEASPPGRATRLLHSMGGRVFANTPLPVWVNLLLLVGGILLIVQSYRVPEHRRTLLVLGLILVVGAIVFWVLAALLAFVFRGRFDGGSGSGGFSSSGGFGGGGFSGGGGATGRW